MGLKAKDFPPGVHGTPKKTNAKYQKAVKNLNKKTIGSKKLPKPSRHSA